MPASYLDSLRDRMTPRPIATSPEKPRRRYAARMPPEQRREQLLDATLEVILERGYSGVSIEAVARTAGVTRPVVYDHFANLNWLLRTLIEREERCALEQLEHVVPTDPYAFEPDELLIQGIRSFLQAVTSRPSTWRIILLPPVGTPAIVRAHIERNRTRTLEQIEQVMRSALARPELPKDLDVELTARVIRDLAEESARMVLTDPEGYPPERYERFAARVMGVLWSRAPAKSEGPRPLA